MPACLLRCFRRVWLSATPWTGAPLGSFIHGTFQARIWERYPCLLFPIQGSNPVSCIAGGFFTVEPLEKSKTTIGSSNPTSEYFSKRTEIRKNCFIPMCIVVLVTIAKGRKHQEMKKNSDMYSFWNIIHLQKWSSDTWFNKIHVCIKP